MGKCQVEGCSNYRKKKDCQNVRFFCFPRNPKLYKKWVIVTGAKVEKERTLARVCSQHFTEEDYKLQDIIMNVPLEKRKLKEGAIPSVNIPCDKGPTFRKERMKKREQRQLVAQAIFNYDRKYSNIPEGSKVTESSVSLSEFDNIMEEESEVIDAVEPEEEILNISTDFQEPEMDPPKNTINTEFVAVSTVLDDPLDLPGPETEKLRKENKQLSTEMKKLTKRLSEAEAVISTLENMFTEGQMKRVRHPEKKFKWSIGDISYAASLYSAGPTGYAQLLKTKYPFPKPALLKKWAAPVQLKPGIIHCVVNQLSQLQLSDKDRLCILSFHEVQLTSEFYEEFPENVKPRKSVQAFIVRGLVSDWKQIIYYNYDCTMVEEIIKNIIQTLSSINLTVVALVSGVGNLKLPLWVEMEIGDERPCIEVIEGEKVFFFGNVPDLIKNFRNNFIDTGFQSYGKLIDVEPLRELLSPDMPDLELGFEFTTAHLSPKKNNRRKVILAWQLLSHAVANAIRKCVAMGKIYSQNAIECSDLIELFANWLDIFNAKNVTGEKVEDGLAYGLLLEDQNSIISMMDELMCSIKRTNSKFLFPFQKGILLNNSSLVQMHLYLKEKYDVGYVSTHILNQDDLECELGMRRASATTGGLPTAKEYEYKINSYVLNSLQNEIKVV